MNMRGGGRVKVGWRGWRCGEGRVEGLEVG